MTKEEIFKAYFSNPGVVTKESLKYDDIVFTNTGARNLSIHNLCAPGFKLTIINSLTPKEEFFMCDDSLLEFDEQRFSELLTDWRLIRVCIMDYSRHTEPISSEGGIFLTWAKASYRGFFNEDYLSDFIEDGENFIENNMIAGNYTLLFEQDYNYAIIVKCHKREEELAPIYYEVTEVLHGHKITTYQGWIWPQRQEKVWTKISYEIPAD